MTLNTMRVFIHFFLDVSIVSLKYDQQDFCSRTWKADLIIFSMKKVHMNTYLRFNLQIHEYFEIYNYLIVYYRNYLELVF